MSAFCNSRTHLKLFNLKWPWVLSLAESSAAIWLFFSTGTCEPDVRLPLPKPVHQGFVLGAHRLAVHVRGRSPGGRVQDR